MKTKIILIIIAVSLFLIWTAIVKIGVNQTDVDERTKELCQWYAKQDHSGEIGKERFEKMGYLWTDFDWYGSCIMQSQGLKYNK